MPPLCPLVCPPTPIMRTASLSSSLCQTRLLLLLFARDGCRSRRAYCTLHTSCSSTILFTVPSDGGSRASAAVSPVLCNEAGCGASATALHLQLAGRSKPDRFITVKKVDSLLSSPKSPGMQLVCLSVHVVT